MRILLSNHRLVEWAGSERWTVEMALEMHRRGHEVQVLTLFPGPVAQWLARQVEVTTDVGDPFDVGLINHAECMKRVRGASAPKVFTTHGRVPEEQPAPGAQRYVAVSPELCYFWRRHKVDCFCLPNAVDLEHYAPRTPLRNEAPRVLSLCKGEPGRAMIQEACDRQGVPVEHHTGQMDPVEDMAELINRFDIVVTLGRGAVEALACGRAVIVFDARPYMGFQPMGDGLLSQGTVGTSQWANFSGRAYQNSYSVEQLEPLVSPHKWDPWDHAWTRPWAERHVDIRRVADRYLELALYTEEEETCLPSPKPSSSRPPQAVPAVA